MVYVECIRGTPLLVQIFIAYFFLGTVFNLSRNVCGIGALALFAGAYVAEAWVSLGYDATNAEAWVPRLMVRRSGSEPLESTFLCVLEPHGGQSGIAHARRLPLEIESGEPCPDSHVALEVTLADGRQDLIVGLANGTVQIYLNENTNAAPVFGTPTLAQAGPVGSKSTIDVGLRATLDIVDWNNDGRFDLVLGAYDGKIGVFLGESDSGEPDFRQELIVFDGASHLVLPDGRSSVAVFDLDGDGRAG